MKQVTGVIFGNYADQEHPELLWRLKRMGKRWQIPVVYCDDFGHGRNHAILQIGRRVRLDGNEGKFIYL
jgi:muramoyltetrapeptide carboxypeptidase